MTRDLEAFRDAIAQRLGLWFDDGKLPFLAEVLQRRLDATRVATGAYLAALADDDATSDEPRALASELTIGETYFFRNGDQFRAFAEVALPERMAARSSVKRLALLSAGSASGEEAYSLAIVARERIAEPGWTVAIRGVDLNPASIAKAIAARYSPWSLRETPPETRRRWFVEEGRELRLDASIRNAVKFEERNLTRDDPDLWPREAYDIVFCRNTLMYFTPDAAQQVVARIAHALAPGGYLFLGHAETLRGLSHEFHLCHTHDTFYYQRKDGPLRAPPAIQHERLSAAEQSPADTTWTTSWVETVQRASERIRTLSENVAPPRTEPPIPPAELATALDLLAHERYSDALDHVPATQEPEVLLLRAVLLAHGGRLDAARVVCLELLAVDELDAGAHYVLALCCEGAGDPQGAIDHDQVAAYLDPVFAMPRMHLGLVARRVGDRETARRELGQAILLLQREDPSRLLLFGGGFSREALVALCRSELVAAGGAP